MFYSSELYVPHEKLHRYPGLEKIGRPRLFGRQRLQMDCVLLGVYVTKEQFRDYLRLRQS